MNKYEVDGIECSLVFALEYYANALERIEGLASVLLQIGDDFSLDEAVTRDGLREIFVLIRDKSETTKKGLRVIFNDIYKQEKAVKIKVGNE